MAGRYGIWRRRGLLAAAAFLLAAPFASGRGFAEEVTLFAAASTAEAVEALAARYAEAGGDEVRAVFAASSTLAKQIARGAPADLFLSASPAWMDYLAERGLVSNAGRRDLMGNRLVLIMPKAHLRRLELRPGAALGAALGPRPLAIADPAHVPAGIYAAAALEALGLWDQLAGRTVRAGDVRAALALVARGEAGAGIVYASDLALSDRVALAGTFPADSHPPIVYPLAVVAGRSRPAVGRFFAYLAGPEAAALFRAHGFLVPAP